eukprot:127623-Pelagomonas_calceolata.AAC.7
MQERPDLWPAPFNSFAQFCRAAGLVQSRAFHMVEENWVLNTRQVCCRMDNEQTLADHAKYAHLGRVKAIVRWIHTKVFRVFELSNLPGKLLTGLCCSKTNLVCPNLQDATSLGGHRIQAMSKLFQLECIMHATEGTDLYLIPAIDMINHASNPAHRNSSLLKCVRASRLCASFAGQPFSSKSFYGLDLQANIAQKHCSTGRALLHCMGSAALYEHCDTAQALQPCISKAALTNTAVLHKHCISTAVLLKHCSPARALQFCTSTA